MEENYCVICNEALGINNPRQYCCKTYCPYDFPEVTEEIKNITWGDKLNSWENGEILTYPESKSDFFWETSPIENFESIYEENFIFEVSKLNIKQNYEKFQLKIDESKSKSVTSFYGLDNQTRLIIPMPREGKNYSTLKNFIDNASIKQQRKFWKKVSKEIKSMLKTHKKIWVSTHGLGVSYLHVRIDIYPKYYQTEYFK